MAPGLSAAVARSHGVIASGVAGVRRAGSDDRITPDDAFHIGSVTKPFTATLAAMLVADGRLSWETRLSEIMPEWRAEMRSEYRDVTLAELLSHESGIPPFEDDADLATLRFTGDAPGQRREFIRYVLTLAPVVSRGTYRYSNAGFVAAAVMIERASGQSWEDLIQTRIAAPLELKTLGFGWPARHRSNQPWGHLAEGGINKPHDPAGEYQIPVLLAPAGDLHMSMDDLAAFLADHLRALRGEPALIPTAIARTVHTRRTRSGLGFGVGKVGTIEPVSTYSGSAGTFVTLIAMAPNANVAVAVSANAADEGSEAAAKKVLKDLLARYSTPQNP